MNSVYPPMHFTDTLCHQCVKLQGQGLIHVASDQVAHPHLEPRCEDAQVVVKASCTPYSYLLILSLLP